MFSSSISVDQISHMTSTAYSWNPFENPDVGGLVFRGADVSSEIQRVKLIWLKQSCCNLPYVKQKMFLHKVIYPIPFTTFGWLSFA